MESQVVSNNMTKESIKENKPAGFRTIINVLRPIRDWLKNSPPKGSPTSGGLTTSLVTMDDIQSSSTTLNNHRTTNDNFRRSTKARMSLPIMQQNSMRRQAYSQLQIRGQPQARSLGHIYLQFMGETKQANLPNELTALDTVKALFVCAFPHLLTMEYMSQMHVKIYIYNPSCNIFYELRDIDDVRHESVLRIHQSDPVLALPQQYQMRSIPQQIPQQIQQQIPQHHHQMQQMQQIPPPKPRRFIYTNLLIN